MDESGGVATRNAGSGVQVRVGNYEFPWRLVRWEQFEKNTSKKGFLVGKGFPIAPMTTQTTAIANDQLPFPMLPTLPQPPPLAPLTPLPLLPPISPLPPVPPSARARYISPKRGIHIFEHGAPIGNAVPGISSGDYHHDNDVGRISGCGGKR